MNIPTIIHQTWKNNELPGLLTELADTWKKAHPTWKYILWTDEMNREFVFGHFPEFIAIYDSYPTNIQRVDAVRYLILYKVGGIFIDLDFECIKNIGQLFSNGVSMLLGEESEEHSIAHKKERIISNAFMASAPGNNFLKAIYDELRKTPFRGRYPSNSFDRVLETTGPFMLTRVYEKYGNKEEISITGYRTLYPFTKSQLKDMSRNDVLRAVESSEAYAVHYYLGTWWNKTVNLTRNDD